jgi:DNA (cytosine-5)-methyltransferase 1
MKHGSLFSGIGGFDLASEWMGWENVFHCEWMEFPRKVLEYHFPNADSHIDICKTDFKKYEGTIDIISGGFPCQPFSLAGKEKGQMMNATYGERCFEQYKKLNRNCHR